MRATLSILILLLALVSGACEDIVDPSELPHEERLIIWAPITVGEPVDSIRLTRTLPIGDVYDYSRVHVDDAGGAIRCEGRSYPLKWLGEGWYAAPGLIPEPGKRYDLEVGWRGRKATASTVAPYPAVIERAMGTFAIRDSTIDSSMYLASTFLRPGEDAYVMGIRTTRRRSGKVFISEEFEEYVSTRGRNLDSASNQIVLRFFYSRTGGDEIPDSVIVRAYDIQYATFWESYWDWLREAFRPNHQYFTGQESLKWNVRGDGIGMFVARAESRKEIE